MRERACRCVQIFSSVYVGICPLCATYTHRLRRYIIYGIPFMYMYVQLLRVSHKVGGVSLLAPLWQNTREVDMCTCTSDQDIAPTFSGGGAIANQEGSRTGGSFTPPLSCCHIHVM